MSDGAADLDVEELAAALGVVDALVFRRLALGTWAHLGGLGRGRGWAGIVSVHEAEDSLLTRIPVTPGAVEVFAHPDSVRVLGPYYAVSGALVRVSGDVLVVLGNSPQSTGAGVDPDDLRRLARLLESRVEDVTPSKRLADELEVLHAVRAVTSGTAADLTGTLQHILDVAVTSLSCDIGVLRDGRGRTLTTGSWEGRDLADTGVDPSLDALAGRLSGGSVCIQDTSGEELLAPLGRSEGVRSLLAIEFPQPVGGLLVVGHTSAGPRGFTDLCRRVGEQVVEAGGVVAHTAALREDLRAAVAEQHEMARRDPLTGLGNRLVWDEAVARAQSQVDGGGEATVITLDVDGLKELNDTQGHDAGDELLRRCAQILVEHGREGDVATRLGGDEFALLLPVGRTLAAQRVAALRERLASATSCGVQVAASVGAATAGPGGSLADAMRDADAAMYADKRTRRAAAHA